MLYWICLFFILIPLIAEKFLLKKWRSTVPVRIHVHGTRGKSSITRNIAEILRSQGIRVLAKTTGDTPEYILPDGKIEPIQRFAPPRIQEHVKILKKAAAMKADVVVVEGMALTPETLFKSEEILSATHAVIANTRPDHAESMGTTREDVIQTLSLMIPEKGQLFTAEEEGAEAIAKLAQTLGASCNIVACPSRIDQSTSIAQAVTSTLFQKKFAYTKDTDTSLCSLPSSCMSNITCFHLNIANAYALPVYCYDFFSVNDVESSQLLCKAIASSSEKSIFTVALLATREDRPLRTQAFLNWVLDEDYFDFVAFAGNHSYFSYMYSLFHKTKTVSKRPFCIRQSPPARLVQTLVTEAQQQGKDSLRLICLGNAHGYGRVWRNFIEASTKPHASQSHDNMPHSA